MRGAFWLTPRIESTRFATIAAWSASSITVMADGNGHPHLHGRGGTTTGGAITVTSGAGIYVTDWFRDTGFQAQDQGVVHRHGGVHGSVRSATGAQREDIADARPAGLQPE
jgi:hypothetical protein